MEALDLKISISCLMPTTNLPLNLQIILSSFSNKIFRLFLVCLQVFYSIKVQQVFISAPFLFLILERKQTALAVLTVSGSRQSPLVFCCIHLKFRTVLTHTEETRSRSQCVDLKFSQVSYCWNYLLV